MDNEALVELLRLARQYLNHPQVTAIPFALPANVIADRLQDAIDDLAPNPVDKLHIGYERLRITNALRPVQPIAGGRRSTFGYRKR